MILSREINKLVAKRQYWKKKLIQVIETMTPITVTRSYHPCGNPQCKRCREEGGKHGPFLYAGYKDAKKKTHSFYVPVELEYLADNGYKAWMDFKEIGKRIGEINREILKLRIKGRGKNDRKD